MCLRSVAAAVLGICTLVLGSPVPIGAATIDDAFRLFYASRFEESAVAAAELTAANPDDLVAWEIRTSALHFQLKRLIGEGKDKKGAFAKCADCPKLLSTFIEEVNRGRAAARARLTKEPMDDEARFLLGKMDLNYLWLQLATLDRKTGWDEYWEAKHLLDAVIQKYPTHVRARVARAWMDYIVGTRVPWGTRWVMGGGSKSRGLKMVREAAQTPADFYTRVEAQFGLWEMLTRDGKRDEALRVAKELLVKFPDNKDLARFVESGGQPALPPPA
jgi:tetratricopeptide (TPR) repeat protein